MAKSPARSVGPDELTPEQEGELCDPAAHVMAETMGSAFDTEEARRAAWEAHGKRLVRKWRQRRPGHRPVMWWICEAGMEGPPLAGSGDIPGVDSVEALRERFPSGWSEQAAFLHEADLLTDAERAALPPLEGEENNQKPGISTD